MPKIRKEEYGDNENVEKRLESLGYYLALAAANKIRNARVTRKRFKQILVDKVAVFESCSVHYEGEIEYTKVKENYKLEYEMADFVGYDQKCVWSVKPAVVGEKIIPIEHAKIIQEGNKGILLDFGSAKMTTILMIFNETTNKSTKYLKSMQALLDKHKEHWTPEMLQLHCLHIANSHKELPDMMKGIPCGEHYFIKRSHAECNAFLAASLNQSNGSPVLTIISPGGTIHTHEQYKKKIAEILIHAALKGEAKKPEPPAKFMETTFDNILKLHTEVLKPENINVLSPHFNGKFEITEVYNPLAKSWEYSEGTLDLHVKFLDKAPDPEKILKALKDAAKDHFVLKLDLGKKAKLFHVPKGNICSACDSSLKDSDQFHCAICKLYFCFECGFNEFAEEPLHPHPLILIQKGSTLKDREFFDVEEENLKSYGYSKVHKGSRCGFCGIKPIIGTRWECANCRICNFCDKCFVKVSENPADIWKDVMAKGHDILRHVYVRVDFAKDGT